MKLIGGLITFLAFFGLSRQFTFNGVLWLLFGIILMAIPAIFEAFVRTERFIHRSNNVKK